jgi:peptidoglycan/LPS O-acetylase OafA/YrhL
MSNTNDNRLEWLDAARGIAALTVLLAHTLDIF